MVQTKAIVVAAYESSPSALITKTISVQAQTAIKTQLQAANFTGKSSEVRLLYGIPGVDAPIVGVVGLGKPPKDIDAAAESARLAASSAVNALRDMTKKHEITVAFDNLGHPIGTAEGANLSTYCYDHLKSDELKASPVSVAPLLNSIAKEDWQTGLVLAEAQNNARTLKETPANLMTPSIFAKHTVELFKDLSDVKVIVHDRDFVEAKKMGSFLSVSNGSEEPLKLVEIHYSGGKKDDAPLSLVGKGVTFDSGGISIKPSESMALMKADMGGAACVVSATWGIAKLKLPINVVTVVPLTENMPSGKATKPGDVVTAMNGKTIEVDNTDAEGRLILADAIYYSATHFKPHSIVELSTLTGAMMVALGSAFTGVFTSSDELWAKLEAAGKLSGDPFWRMPLSDKYKPQISSNVADLKNVGVSPFFEAYLQFRPMFIEKNKIGIG